jgi:ankyrin repeat protein
VLAHGIFAAVARNDPPSLQFVLDQQGADPNDAVDTMLDSALCRACSHWFNKCVELLVQHGADVNQAGNAFRTPLYYATEHDNSKAAMYLLEHGADPNRAGDELAAMRFTPLHFAAGHGDLPLIRLLASKGADVNASATDGNGTPIHYAGRSGDYLDRALYNQVVAELMRLGGRDSKWCSAGSRATATSITHAWSSFGFSGYGYRQA